MGFGHWFSVPLLDMAEAPKSDFHGEMKQMDLSSGSHSTTSLSFVSELNGQDHCANSKKELPNIELFKILIKNQCEKSELLKDTVSFL